MKPARMVKLLEQGKLGVDQLSDKQVSALFDWLFNEYGQEYLVERLLKNMTDEDWQDLIKNMRENGVKLPPSLDKLLH